MKRSLACAMAAAAAVQAGAAELGEGVAWQDLFDGKTLGGWVQRNGKAEYRVEDGCVVGSSVLKSPNSFLCTEKDYSDFILEFEFKAHPRMNSGVQIRSQSLTEYKDGRVHGYQCELEDEEKDRDWSCGIYDEGRRGWLYPAGGDKELQQRFGEQGRKLWKAGEWNKIRVEAVGDRIRTWLNGEPRADLKDNMTPKGFIALQVHSSPQAGWEVRWRNLRIKDLSASK